jgi:WD40 repeat protein
MQSGRYDWCPQSSLITPENPMLRFQLHQLCGLAVFALAAINPGTLTAADAVDDPLPEGATARFGSPRFLDHSIGGPVAFSPDGKQLATGWNNSPVCVWDAVSGKLLRTHNPVASVLDLRWKPDGKLVAITYFGGNGVFMHEWVNGHDDGPSAERVGEMLAEAGRKEQKGYTGTASLSADGSRLVSVRHLPDSTRLAEVFAFVPNRPSALVEPERSIALRAGHSAGFSQNGKSFIAQWDALTEGEERFVAYDLTAGKNSDKPAWELAFKVKDERRVSHSVSADGQKIVVVFLNGEAELWDGPNGKLVRELPKAPLYYLTGGGERTCVALSPDEKKLAMVGRQENGEVGGRVLDLDTGKDLVTLTPQSLPRLGGGIAFSPDSKRLAVAGTGAIRIWNTETGADACPLPGHRGRINSVVASADGKTVVTSADDLTVRAWDPATGREKWKVAFPQVLRVKFATADAAVIESDYGAGVAEPLLDLANGKARSLPGAMGKGTEVPGMGFGVGGTSYDSLVAIAPDGKSAVTLENYSTDLVTQQTALRVWSWPAGELKKTMALDVPKDLFVSRLEGRFTPDGKELLTAAWCRLQNPPFSGPVSIPVLLDRWDMTTGKRIERKQTRDVHPVWTRDGSQLLVVRDKGELQDAFSGKAVAKLTESPTDQFIIWTLGGMSLSPDGKTLAVGGSFNNPGAVRLYDMKTGQVTATLPVGGWHAMQVAFLPDGRLVSAGSTALVWKALRE